MTQQTDEQPAIVRRKTELRPGDTTWTWCSKSMDREPHIYTGVKLVCQCDRCKAARGEPQQ
jgi:hypothetical protein